MKRFFVGMLLVAVTSSLRAESPTITRQPVSLTVTNGTTAAFDVAVSGTGPFTYRWQYNGTNLVPDFTKIAGATVRPSSPPVIVNLLSTPNSVAVDRFGNVFFADAGGNRVCKVDTNGIIRTVAGSLASGFSGDGGPAVGAALGHPGGIALDETGNLFVADYDNNRIRRVDVNGIITTVAGNGTSTNSGDGGLATNAGVAAPRGLAFDKAGNLFFSTYSSVRKVDVNGIITTVAGGGTGGDGGPAISASLSSPAGIAFDGSGNLLIADKNRVRKVDALGIIRTVAGGGNFTVNGIAATNATFFSVQGIAVDAWDNLFISDVGWSSIRKVDAQGIFTTVASSACPAGVAVDASGNLFIADTSSASIVKLNIGPMPKLILTNAGLGNAGNYSVIVGSPGGVATSQVATLTVLMPPSISSQPTNQIVLPGGIATFNVSASGDGTLSYCWLRDGVSISGANDSSYSISNAQGSDSGAKFQCVITNAFGSVTSYVATLSVSILPSITLQPVSRFVTNGNTVVFSVMASGPGPLSYQWQRNGTNLSSTITTVAGNGSWSYSGDGGPATNAGLGQLLGGIAADSAGNLFISANNRIRKVDSSGIITTIVGNGTTGYSGDGGPATNAKVSSLGSIASDGLGNLFFSDQGDHCIRKVDANGIISTVAGSGFLGDGGPATSIVWYSLSAALGSSGDLFLADYRNYLVRKVDALGRITTFAGNGTGGYSGDGGPATSAGLSVFRDLAADGAGNVWIADYSNGRVRRVDLNGTITTVAGNGVASYSGDGGPAISASLSPAYIAVDGAGNLLISDAARIRKVDAAGVITTVAGNGVSDYSGDGGPATSAAMRPGDIALDGSGNLFVVDGVPNFRVRKVNYLFGTTPTLVLTNVDVANAGDYSVIVRCPYGCVTSSVVNLSVWSLLQPQGFTGALSEGKNLAFQFKGTPSYPYVLQSATNLTPPIRWEVVATNLTGADGVWKYGVIVTNEDSPARFYRVLGPAPQ